MDEDMGPFAGMDAALVDAVTRYGTAPIRQVIEVVVEDIGHDDFDETPETIDDWIEFLSNTRSAVPHEYRAALKVALRWSAGYYDSGDSASFRIWYERPETDAEMIARVGRGIAYVKSREAQERATYEALRRKFAT